MSYDNLEYIQFGIYYFKCRISLATVLSSGLIKSLKEAVSRWNLFISSTLYSYSSST